MTYKDWNELRNEFIKFSDKVDKKYNLYNDLDLVKSWDKVRVLIDKEYELDKLETYLDADGNEVPNDFTDERRPHVLLYQNK